jgi:hypothetical protein
MMAVHKKKGGGGGIENTTSLKETTIAHMGVHACVESKS